MKKLILEIAGYVASIMGTLFFVFVMLLLG